MGLDDRRFADLSRLVRLIDARATLRRTWPLKGGISSRMTAIEVAFEDGRMRRMVVRQPSDETIRRHPRAAADEFKLLQILQSTVIPAPAPYHLDESRESLATTCLVIEYIDGAPESSPTDVSDFIAQFAARLAEIHRIDGVDVRLAFLPKHSPCFVEQRGRAVTDAALNVKRIREVLEATWPADSRNRLALLHGDYWPGNVVWKDGQLRGVIDWEEARIGDPIADLATSRLDILWAFGIDAMIAFTDCYQASAPIDLTDLPYWDLDAALRPAFNIAQWASAYPDLGRSDITETTMRAGHALFVSQAFEALSI